MTTARSRATTRASAPSTSRPLPEAGPWRAAGHSRTGTHRAHNEDGWLVVPSEGGRPLLIAVADGVGGEVGGAHASAAALETLAVHWRAWRPASPPTRRDVAERLAGAGRAADASVRALGRHDPALHRAATTLTAAVLFHAAADVSEAHVLHAGDSRAYRLGASGTVDQLTDDHTWVREALHRGEVTPDEARIHPQRNVIVEFLGRPDGCTFDSSVVRLERDDGILLCTDGVSGLLSPDALERVLRDRGRWQAAAVVERLIAEVTERAGGDDATAVAALPETGVDPFGLRRAEAPSRAQTVAAGARRPILLAGSLLGVTAAVGATALGVLRWVRSRPAGPPAAAAREYLAAFQAGEYDALYPLLTRRARSAIDRTAFVQRHEAVAAEMTLSALDLRLTDPAEAPPPGAATRLPFEALYRTARFGELRRRNELPVVWEDGRWAIDWNPAVLLPELGGGRLVRAVSDAATRGSILDRALRPFAATAAAGRSYPTAEVAGPLVGYVGQVSPDELKELAPRGLLAGDSVGRAGIESASEALLAGQRGGRLTVLHPTGDVADTLATVPPRAGETVVLTIDSDIQREVEALLGNRPGSAIVIDARNGAVRALASAPRYDPNAFAGRGNPAGILTDPAQPLILRPLQGQYPAGSTFKVITMAAGLESGAFTPESEFTCSGRWTGLPGIAFDCWLRTGHGRQTLVEGLTHSCNSVFYEIGKRLDEINAEILPSTAAQCGIGRATGVAGTVEAAGVAPSPAWKQRVQRDGWARGDAVNLAIGQGQLLVTPIQLAAVYLGIATSGQGPGIRLLDRTLLPGGSVERTLPSAQPLLRWSGPTLEAIRAGLRGVVGAQSGTAAHIFQGSPLAGSVAGKTGTAEAGPGRQPHAWFACYAPFDAPKAVVLVMLENAGEGSAVAAPVARRILEAVLDRI